MTTTCPWCGTSYTSFRSNCRNCGGPLPPPREEAAAPSSIPDIPGPPPAPRDFKDSFALRQLSADGWAIAAGIFALIGAIFTLIGIPLMLVVAGFALVPLGLLFLGVGVPILIWRYNLAQQTLNVLRMGEPVLGSIVDIHENIAVEVNGRHPWTITYGFEVDGEEYEGQTTTLRPVGFTHQVAQPMYVLYLPDDPTQNTVYPPVM
jgi:hypothetical protein